MRVKFGKTIRRVKFATHVQGSTLLSINTDNGLYFVNIKNQFKAERLHRQLLEEGWIDVSLYEYSNQ